MKHILNVRYSICKQHYDWSEDRWKLRCYWSKVIFHRIYRIWIILHERGECSSLSFLIRQ